VFEIRMLSRIIVSKRKEVTGSWEKLHGGQLHMLYASSDIITVRQNDMTAHVARMGVTRN
jgi:hypothetical protein